ncbi:MAG TPA: hypothetical protein VFL93_10525 [Longimicrobiaceae bacterium]|jgi:hypothetical protein|nr:hypothetical protein [Longimicrobiaceae bacterium]
MADEQSESAGAGRTSGQGGAFPTNAVVGVVDGPRDLVGLVESLRAAGFEPEVLCGERGVERIENAGGSARDVRITRVVQGMFGYEAEHSARHTREIEEGHYVVVVRSEDDETTDRIGDIFADHAGHFVNYYTRWTGRPLIP